MIVDSDLEVFDIDEITHTSIFGNSNPQPQEWHFLPGASLGISVPES